MDGRQDASPNRMPPAWPCQSTTWIGLHSTKTLPMTRPSLGELVGRLFQSGGQAFRNPTGPAVSSPRHRSAPVRRRTAPPLVPADAVAVVANSRDSAGVSSSRACTPLRDGRRRALLYIEIEPDCVRQRCDVGRGSRPHGVRDTTNHR